MPELPTTADRILEYRADLLLRLEYALIRFRCRATVEDIQRFIYERDEARPVGEYIQELIAVFDPPDAEMDDATSVIQEAWNFLPHRVYGGRSPAEVMLELETKKPLRRTRRKSGTTEKRI